MSTPADLPIIIRTYQPSDLSSCQALFLESQREYNNPKEYEQHAFETDMADIEKNYLQVPNAHWWVAVSTTDNRIVGQVAVQPLQLGSPLYYAAAPPEERDYICELRRMGVSFDVQRLGVGSRLLVTLFNFALQQGYRRVHLTTFANMYKACLFYEKHGFVKGDLYRLPCDDSKITSSIKSGDDVEYIETILKIYKAGDVIPEEDQERMKLPPSVSKYQYIQSYFFDLLED